MGQEQEKEQDAEQAEEQKGQRDTILRVENLSKTYSIPNGKLRILQQINLQVQQGEFIAITGQSGSGKTTLLSLLGALDSPDSGEIWLGDIAVHRLRGPAAADFRRQQIGFVFQLFYLLPNLTALENVMAPLLPYRRKLGFDLKQRAQELLESVGLGDRLGHPPARLSGGEQQRAAQASV
ncbi:MAG TPA: ATP-binding cassette domain-containing protein [Ktedonobacteraceae bacterium]|nr:ATP-binding cassette domain-containing protein [Ktedonobacteraceae bacterium]